MFELKHRRCSKSVDSAVWCSPVSVVQHDEARKIKRESLEEG